MSDSLNVMTGKVRASFVNVFQPKTDMKGRDKYSMMLLIPKDDTETVEALKGAFLTAKKAKWGEQKIKVKPPLRDGDAANDEAVESDGRVYPEFNGHYLLNVTNYNRRPGLVDEDLNDIIDQKDFRSGDYCRCSLRAFSYDTDGNKGVSFALNNIQRLARGEPLDGTVKPQDEFTKVKKEDAADDDWESDVEEAEDDFLG